MSNPDQSDPPSRITFHFDEKKGDKETKAGKDEVELLQKTVTQSESASVQVHDPLPSTVSSGLNKPPPKKKDDETPADLTEAEKELNQFLTLERLMEKFQTSLDLTDLRRSKGLTSAEAATRLARDGPNILTPPPQTPEIIKYFSHYIDPFMLLLNICAVLSVISYAINPGAVGAITSVWIAIVLWVVIIFSCTFGYIQEGKASDAMKSFKGMLSESAHVIRDGRLQDIPTRDVVVGDVVRIATGDKTPCDLRIYQSANCKCDLSSLTGESVPVTLGTTSGARKREEAKNLCWNTAKIVEGEAYGIAVACGDHTLIGEIKTMTAGASTNQTPIQIEINRFVKLLTIFSIILGAIFFGIGMGTGSTAQAAFVNGFIVVMVANVPEGLPMTVVSCLTITARRMAELKVFIKELKSVETLGSVTCICSDKTGTLTQNKMTASHLFYDNGLPTSAGSVLKDAPPQNLQQAIGVELPSDRSQPPRPAHPSALHTLHHLELVAGLCNHVRFEDNRNLNDDEAAAQETTVALRNAVSNNGMTMRSARAAFPLLTKMADPSMTLRSALSKFTVPDDSKRTPCGGDASEMAMFNFIVARQSIELMRYHYPIVHDQAFNSRVKFAATIVKPYRVAGTNHNRLLLMKGAPEVIISKCSHFKSNGVNTPIDAHFKSQFDDAYEQFAGLGERVIGFAYLELDPKKYGPEKDAEYAEGLEFPTEGLVFLGLMSLIDPHKESVPGAVEACRQAGVKVVMVTGDHPLTAASIARNVKILTLPTRDLIAHSQQCSEAEVLEEDVEAIVLKGTDIESFDQSTWDRVLSKKEIVFARTTPAQKLQIVENFQRLGNIVAVTGDGVNDSPALKRADIGLAMGISGSDVARDAADVILMDDDFASIVVGIREGRTIFDNLAKTIAYTVTHMVPEVMPALLNLSSQIPLALNALQVLFIDLCTELAPAISLAYEPAESNVMQRPPRNAKVDRLVNGAMVVHFLLAGAIECLFGFLVFFLVFNHYGIIPSDLVGQSNNFFPPSDTNFTAPDSYFYPNSNPKRAISGDDQYEFLAEAQSAYWLMLTAGQAGHIWLCKTRKISLFSHGLFGNSMMIMGSIIQWCTIVLIIYFPFTQSFFGNANFPGFYWFMLFAVWAALFILHELRKWWVRQPQNKAGIIDRFMSW